MTLDAILFMYTSVLVMGFLFTTLEKHMVASADRVLEFRASLALFLVLWAMNFLTILDDRYIYSSDSWLDNRVIRKVQNYWYMMIYDIYVVCVWLGLKSFLEHFCT